jgi:hypothetical protein
LTYGTFNDAGSAKGLLMIVILLISPIYKKVILHLFELPYDKDNELWTEH